MTKMQKFFDRIDLIFIKMLKFIPPFRGLYLCIADHEKRINDLIIVNDILIKTLNDYFVSNKPKVALNKSSTSETLN